MLPDPFHSVPDHARRRLQLAMGQAAFRQGDPTKGLFVVLFGKMALERHTETGDKVVLHTAIPGETFAEASLFTDAYHCDAVALHTSELVELDRGHILETFHSDAEFAAALTRRFATQVQTYRRKLELLAISGAEERVFAALADGMLTHSVKAFAAEINLTHEAVYRALKSLATRGRILKTGRGAYEIRRAGLD